jgi:hypothetical protein
VPLGFANTDDTNFIAYAGSELASLKRLAFLLIAEGRLAEKENHPADAARSYVDCIRFGNELSRGGLMINRLVGIACEAIGYRPLLSVLPTLSAEEMAEVARRLDEIRRASVPWEEVWRAERRYVGRITRIPFASALATPLLWSSKRKAQQKDSRMVAQLSLLITELALRRYHAEYGKPPTQLKALSPQFLRDLPFDPFNGRPLVYRPQGTNWVLYSVGPDGVDHGGVAIARGSSASVHVGFPFFSDTVPAGDVFYDSPL